MEIRRLLGNSRTAIQLTSPRILKYFQNVSWLLFERVFSMFVALLVNIYVARYLQPDGFGLLNYSLSFVAIFSAFTTLGLDQIFVRELSKQASVKENILGTGFFLKLGGSATLSILVLAILPFMNNDTLTNALILIIAAAEFFRAFEVISLDFQSKVMSKYVVQVQLLVNLLGNIFKIGLVFMEAPLIWFAWSVLLNTIGNALGYVMQYRSHTGSLFNWRFDNILAIRFLKESWPLAIQSLALLIQIKVDQIMLGKLVGLAEVAQYSVAARFIDIFSLLPGVVVTTFVPAITRGKELSPEIYSKRMINLYRLMFAMFLAIGIPIYFFSKDIVVLLYGLEYEAAGVILSLFVFRLFFINIGLGKLLYMVNEGLFKFTMITSIVGALTCICLNLFLIPIYGVLGAIMANLLSFTFSEYVIEFFYRKTRRNLGFIFKGVFSFWRLREGFENP